LGGKWRENKLRQCGVGESEAHNSSTAQHSTAQHSTAQYSTVQHNATQHNTAQHNTHERAIGKLQEGEFATTGRIVEFELVDSAWLRMTSV